MKMCLLLLCCLIATSLACVSNVFVLDIIDTQDMKFTATCNSDGTSTAIK